MRNVVNAIQWFFTPESIRGRKYRRDIDYLKENTEINLVTVIMQAGVIREDYDQCHAMMADLVEYAHSRGIRVVLTVSAKKGFYNPGFDPNIRPELGQAEVYTVNRPENAQALAQETELVADENGYAYYEHHACGARSKIRPLYAKLLKIYAFDKTREGFYRPGSLADVTDKAQILECRTHMLSADIFLGKAFAGKTLYVLTAQYYNWNELFGDSDWPERKALMDMYADVALDGVVMDEFGYMLLDTADVDSGRLPPFRSRFYSPAQKEWYRKKFGLDLDRELLNMRYVPEGEEKTRVAAINRYFDELREPVLREERRVAEYAKKLFGENAYLGVHNTFHNNLERDEVWHTVCAWWELPRQYGHTDEFLAFPARMGILLSEPDPLMLHMYYSKKPEEYYREMTVDAPFNIRIFHHALDDFYWGSSYRDPEMVRNLRVLDRQIARLNDFQTAPPKMNLLILFSDAAQYNWYPDTDARNEWDVDGKIQILQKCDAIWDAGYRGALVPDRAVADGRVRLEGKRFTYGGHTFDHCLYLYPKYARKETYAFLNRATEAGASLCVVGPAVVDFDGDANSLLAETNESFSAELLERMGCEKLAIPNGSLYANGGFCLVHEAGLLRGEKTAFDFEAEGCRCSGVSTGLVACRPGEAAFATPGSELRVNGVPVELELA